MALTGEAKKEYNKKYYKAKNQISKTIVDYTYMPTLIDLLYGYTDNEENIYFNLTINYHNACRFSNFTDKFSFGEYSAKELYDRKLNGWSDLVWIRFEAIANFLNASSKTVSRKFAKLEEEDLVKKFIVKAGTKDNPKLIALFQINLAKIRENHYYSENYKDVCNNYFNSLVQSINKDNSKKKQNKMRRFATKYPFATEYHNNFLQIQEDGTYKGLRLYTALCGTKNPDTHEEHPLERYYMLDDCYNLYGYNFKHLNTYEEYQERYTKHDVNAMSLRTNKNIILYIQGKPFIANDIDIYEHICKIMKFSPIDNFHESELRKIIKVELQSMFQNLSAIYVKCQKYRETINTGNINIETQQLLEKAYKVKELTGMEYDKFLNKLKYAFYDFLRYKDEDDYCIDNDVTSIIMSKRLCIAKDYYPIESCIFCEMNNYFKNLNIITFNVFDCSYGLKDEFTEEMFLAGYEYAIKTLVNKMGKENILKSYLKEQKYYDDNLSLETISQMIQIVYGKYYSNKCDSSFWFYYELLEQKANSNDISYNDHLNIINMLVDIGKYKLEDFGYAIDEEDTNTIINQNNAFGEYIPQLSLEF